MGRGCGRSARRLPRLRALPVRGGRREGAARRSASTARHSSREALEAFLAYRYPEARDRRPKSPRRPRPARASSAHERHREGRPDRPWAPASDARRSRRPTPGALEQRVHELERELRGEREAKRADSLLVALARAVSSGAGALDWASLGRLQRALYFAWHSEETDEFGADARFAERLQPFFEFLYTMWWRVEAHGHRARARARGRADRRQPLGRAAVRRPHGQPRDPPRAPGAARLPHAGARHVRAAAVPGAAAPRSRSGAREPRERRAPAARGRAAWASSRKASRAWASRFRERYQLARFGRGGFVRVALRTGAPIVPCAVVGAEEIHPMVGQADWVGPPVRPAVLSDHADLPAGSDRSGCVPLPTKWSIDFGEPIDARRARAGGSRGPDPREPHRREVRATIQRMVDGRLARRRSVWFG